MHSRIAKQHGFFPDGQDQSAIGDVDGMRAAGGIDDQRADVVVAAIVGLGFGKNEQMLVTKMFVQRNARAGFVEKKCRRWALVWIAVEAMDFHAGTEVFPFEESS